MKRLILERLEKAYELSQSVYDGYELQNQLLLNTQLRDANEWLTLRKHPGKEMNELKMLIRVYADGLIEKLDAMDVHHQDLKTLHKRMDNVVREGTPPLSARTQTDQQRVEADLAALGDATNALKTELVTLLREHLPR
ncbi:hypothetical protein [Pseudorhizobium tarimense]|uniref:hypothetical protein n=1 Tax=Pseudorhizobium tarimense TaxID=1079109 RepID=UPI001FF24281|nr:hypothetical protein [Pseudorhizobium tarimense]